MKKHFISEEDKRRAQIILMRHGRDPNDKKAIRDIVNNNFVYPELYLEYDRANEIYQKRKEKQSMDNYLTDDDFDINLPNSVADCLKLTASITNLLSPGDELAEILMGLSKLF